MSAPRDTCSVFACFWPDDDHHMQFFTSLISYPLSILVVQVRNAQRMGAAGVLIADTEPVCIDQAHLKNTLGAPCQR